MKQLILLAALSAASLCIPSATAAALDTAKIDELTGLKGKLDEKEQVYKVSFPRDEVKVTVAGWPMPPFMGLGTWAAFHGTDEKAMVMGDTVLFEDEVNAAMSAALDNGLQVTALHNHFFFDQPKVYFMHIGGEGSTEKLARAVRKVYDAAKAVRAKKPNPGDSFPDAAKAPLPAESSISLAPLQEIFGVEGESKDGMAKFTIGRTAEMKGMQIGKTMGVNTWAAFAGADENAVVDGDFAMTEAELQPVLKSLRSSGINVVAIHNHMTGESPRIMFLHYWGRGSARELATAVKNALAKTGHDAE